MIVVFITTVKPYTHDDDKGSATDERCQNVQERFYHRSNHAWAALQNASAKNSTPIVKPPYIMIVPNV